MGFVCLCLRDPLDKTQKLVLNTNIYKQKTATQGDMFYSIFHQDYHSI